MKYYQDLGYALAAMEQEGVIAPEVKIPVERGGSDPGVVYMSPDLEQSAKEAAVTMVDEGTNKIYTTASEAVPGAEDIFAAVKQGANETVYFVQESAAPAQTIAEKFQKMSPAGKIAIGVAAYLGLKHVNPAHLLMAGVASVFVAKARAKASEAPVNQSADTAINASSAIKVEA